MGWRSGDAGAGRHRAGRAAARYWPVTGLHGRAAVAPGPSSLAAEAGLDGLSV